MNNISDFLDNLINKNLSLLIVSYLLPLPFLEELERKASGISRSLDSFVISIYPQRKVQYSRHYHKNDLCSKETPLNSLYVYRTVSINEYANSLETMFIIFESMDYKDEICKIPSQYKIIDR